MPFIPKAIKHPITIRNLDKFPTSVQLQEVLEVLYRPIRQTGPAQKNDVVETVMRSGGFTEGSSHSLDQAIVSPSALNPFCCQLNAIQTADKLRQGRSIPRVRTSIVVDYRSTITGRQA
jgi:hypothetical protein